MNKNSVIGFILIGIVLFGFSWYQSRQYKKQAAERARLDSIARVENLARLRADSIGKARLDSMAAASGVTPAELSAPFQPAVSYKDSLLSNASAGEAELVTLENDRISLVLTSKGAQPYSVKVKDYFTYDSTDLYIIKPDWGRMNVKVHAGENIDLADFVFTLAESSDSSAVFQLPFSNGGCIELRYSLTTGSYEVASELAFVGMRGVMPANVSSADLSWNVTIPRMEKGYKNEKQYSKLDYYFSGDKKPEEFGRGRDGSKRITNRVKWFAFQQQFFSMIVTSEDEFASGDFGVRFASQEKYLKDGVLMDCEASMRSEFKFSDDIRIPLKYYFGPNHFRTLKDMDGRYEKIIPLGGNLVGWISRFVIIPCFNWLSRWISSYGLIILIMTILLKIVISPLTVKSYKSSASMQILKPDIEKLNEKYPRQEDAMKKQQAQMELYKKAGVSPMGGCLPMLLQFPVLWAMFRFFPASIELRQQSFLWAKDLSAYDSILDFGFNVPLYGDHISLFALLMAVTMWGYSKMTMQQQATDPNMKGMQFMSVWMMPIMMLFICNNLSSALSYYYLLSNILTMAQTWMVKKWFVDEKKIRARMAAYEGKSAPKSKWQQRLEEAQKMQRQQMARKK